MGLYPAAGVSRGNRGTGIGSEAFRRSAGLPVRAGTNLCVIREIAGGAEDGGRTRSGGPVRAPRIRRRTCRALFVAKGFRTRSALAREDRGRRYSGQLATGGSGVRCATGKSSLCCRSKSYRDEDRISRGELASI